MGGARLKLIVPNVTQKELFEASYHLMNRKGLVNRVVNNPSPVLDFVTKECTL